MTDAEAKLAIIFPRTEIAAAVARLASEITGDYRDRNPLLLGVLRGCFVFLADLVRALDFPLEVDFIRLSSYNSGTQSSGQVKVGPGPRLPVAGRHLLVVEDIVDTGLTLAFLLDYLVKKKPASLKVCALTSKPSRRQTPVEIDYLGLTVPDKFLVGYGLDRNGKYRNLPDICCLEEES